MYTPRFNHVPDEDEIRAMVAAARTAWFVTADADGVPVATLLPIIWRGDTVIAHMARANRQWRTLPDAAPALLIVAGPEAYISPSWYASKAEHGKVVPTWNYSAVHLSGTAVVHTDAEWLRDAVADLTEMHESERAQPWAITDAPADFIDEQLPGIVGIEISVTKIEGKAKLSQNRSEVDRLGVIDGLEGESFAGAAEVTAAMRAGIEDAGR
ncbi:transcriptional regulator [Microbacterium sp. ZKA21]|uniref:FMN-binding negative transcriptional regulator n=1 Tax=Microbacterium sp. ZKA21 TaxID=3381694 RepID=UPI003D1D0B20